MVGGQAIDLQAAGQAAGHALTLDAEGLRGMHARKTGALITRIGRERSRDGRRRRPADRRRSTEYAAELGLAFQIVDDVLDVEGDAATLGKTAGKDAASAKPSYPALFGLDRSRAMAAECVERAKAASIRSVCPRLALADRRLGHAEQVELRARSYDVARDTIAV